MDCRWGGAKLPGTIAVMDPLARQVHVTGRVQGVAFRWHTVEVARSLGVDGWVRNLDDGRVEAWIEGPSEQVEKMLEWLGTGPPAARVDGIESRDREPARHTSFEVR